MQASLLLLAVLAGDPADSWLNGTGFQAEETLFIRAERVLVRPGVEIENGAILVERGVIVAVGADVQKPDGAREIQGKVACAGFVDPWSSLGVDGSSTTDLTTNAATRTVDGFDPWRLPNQRGEALSGGVTSARVQAGASALLGGIGAVFRTDPGPEPDVVLEDACISATVGVSRGGRAADIFDRSAEVDRLIGMIEKGRRYREEQIEYRYELEEWEKGIAEKRQELEKDFKKAKKKRDKEVEEAEEKGKELKEKKYKEDKKPKKPKVDPNAEAMARVAEGDVPLVVEVHRAAELRNLLEKTERFDRLRLVIAGGTEALHLADELSERRIPVIVWPAPLGADKKAEHRTHDLSLAAELDRAGVEVLIGSGGGPHARELRFLAAMAVSYGLDAEAALGAITTGPAKAFDVGRKVGSLERGRDADILLFDGDPLDSTSQLETVVSGGRVVVP